MADQPSRYSQPSARHCMPAATSSCTASPLITCSRARYVARCPINMTRCPAHLVGRSAPPAHLGGIGTAARREATGQPPGCDATLVVFTQSMGLEHDLDRHRMRLPGHRLTFGACRPAVDA